MIKKPGLITLERIFNDKKENLDVKDKFVSLIILIESKLEVMPLFYKSVFIKDIKRKLHLLRIDRHRYAAIKALLTFVAGIFGMMGMILGVFDLSLGLFLIPLSMFAGFILPDLYVFDKDNNRNFKINSEFPNLLDLLNLYAASAAFEHFGSALYQISQNMSGLLAEELRQITSIYPYLSKEEFLNILEERFKDPLAQDLIATVRLTETYGGNVAQKISILAEEAHKDRLQKAKELGQKSTVALMVPLMIFHFPVAVIIFMAPTIFTIQKIFAQ